MEQTNAKVLFEGKIPEVSVEQIRREGNFSMARQHFHSSYEIYYLLEGERSYFIESKTYHVLRGNLIFVGSGQIHKTTMISPVHERILLEISENLMERFCRETGVCPAFSMRSGVLKLEERERKRAESLLFRIIAELREKRPAYEREIQALLEELLIFILRKGNSSEREYPAVKSVKHRKVGEVADYIRANFSEISSLDFLSERFYISKYYLCRIFKEVTGMTISQYLNANRLKAAERMLRESSDSIIRIAAASGFGNVTYFDKIFRESMGLSPSQYRKSREDSLRAGANHRERGGRNESKPAE